MVGKVNIPEISQKHLHGIKDLTVDDINKILELSNFFKLNNKEKDKNYPILKGRTVINLFFEPSTRTLISFEIAAKRLGADVINMNIEGSSLRKGESLHDTAQTLGAMNPDLVVIRHEIDEASKQIAEIVNCPVINAGEGINEHPTQALLDAYTIINNGRNLENITVAICGDLEHSRVARSNYYLLNKMKSKVRFVYPEFFKPKDLDKYDVETFTDLEKGITDVDIVMMLRIQNERISDLNLPSIESYFEEFGLTYKKLELAKPEALVLHPGPINRNVEIEDKLANDIDKSVINEQVENGVAVRMACLSIMVK
jgi:aspartate carbamoyltransferase catalytic subunit|tara:strand:- start:79 stop:1017 length:939 start_codon:yes stop_codon:yes gene_type:complete